MTPQMLLGGLAGLGVGVGILLMIAGLRPAETSIKRDLPARWQPRLTTRLGGRHVLAIVLGMLAWILSSWPVAGVIVTLTTLGLPALLSTAHDATLSIERIEAVEEWTRRLSDILVVGVGLEQAIATSVRSVPEPIRLEVTTLAAKLGARRATEDALREFADDLNDATGDFVVAALILGHRRRGPGLARALAALAESVGQEVSMRRAVEADRAKPRATARAVTLITLGVVALGALNRTYLSPYGTAVGQLVLLAVTALFTGSLLWMRALTVSEEQPRLLRRSLESS